jgi:hypothetical protein
LTVKAEHDCKRELICRMAANPKERPAKRGVLTKMQERYPGLSEKAFNRAWKEAAEETGAKAWSEPGRKS